jgi:hypothetical protein
MKARASVKRWPARRLPLKGAKNFRDLAGYRTASEIMPAPCGRWLAVVFMRDSVAVAKRLRSLAHPSRRAKDSSLTISTGKRQLPKFLLARPERQFHWR